MLNLPSSTTLNRFLPKDKFYSKTAVSAKLRKQFTDEIERITWTHKISPDTLNITADGYDELQVFLITLKGSELSEAVLKHIDSFVPYPVLFILQKEGELKAKLSYKETSLNNEKQMAVRSYFETPWQKELNLELKGRSVKEIYNSFLQQIAPELRESNQDSMAEAVALSAEQNKIQKQINALNRRIANEPAPSKKQELARERFILEQQLGGL